MANPQPNCEYGIIAHEIQENLIIRDFSELLLKILYLIIRLSWGCGVKAWQYSSYKDFEVIGIYKSDVANHLKYLKNNKVIDWVEKYNLLIFNKDYDQWKIPIKKKSSEDFINKLVHESLKNANDVRNLLTILGNFTNDVSNSQTKLVKIPNEVSKNPERFESATPTAPMDIEAPKESIKESIIIMSNDEACYIKTLEKIVNYPLDREKDVEYYKALSTRYPTVDLLEMIKDYSAYKLDSPLKPKDNPRSQINTQCKLCIKWGKCLKKDKPLENNQVASNGRHEGITADEEFLKANGYL